MRHQTPCIPHTSTRLWTRVRTTSATVRPHVSSAALTSSSLPSKASRLSRSSSVDRTNRRNGQYNDYQSVSNYQSAGPSTIENGYDAVTTLDWQNTVNYALELNEKHAFNFLLGHEMSQTVSEGLDVNGSTLKEHYYKSSFYDVSKILAPAATSSYTKHSLLSFFGRVNYSYLSRYLFSASSVPTVRRCWPRDTNGAGSHQLRQAGVSPKKSL